MLMYQGNYFIMGLMTDDPGLKKIIDLYYSKVLKMCLFYLKNEEEALDITQDVFLKIAKKIDSFREESKVFTWIYIITKNTILNYLKKKKIINFFSFESLKSTKSIDSLSARDNPETVMEAREQDQLQIKRLENAIDLLSDREKTAFYLFHYDNLKQKEIAQIMNTSISAVESLIYKSKQKIKKNLLSKES